MIRAGVWTAACAWVIAMAASAALADDAPADDQWLAKVRLDHPRMFINRDTLPIVKAYALGSEKAYYEKIRRRVADMPDKADEAAFSRGSQVLYGPYAQMAALVYLVEGDKSALAKAHNYVLEAVRFYNRRSDAGQGVNWYSADRVATLTAYDWLHDHFTDAERKEIVNGFLRHYSQIPVAAKRGGRVNWSDYRTGFYGPSNLPWYIGLAFYRDGVNDAEAERLLRQGYAQHMELMDYRSTAAGDDGGMGSAAVGYGFGMYPWSEFNFMHTLASATGITLEDHYDHMSLFPNWVFWNRLPGAMSWGLADSVPAGKFAEGFLEMHMMQIAHFWARRYPDRAAFALWLRRNLLSSQEHDDYWWPVAPLYDVRCADLPEARGPDASWPLARNFENMGVVFMRSDWTDDATCAAFVAGGTINQHRHYDQGHFIIYRRGAHLALDSGDYGPRERNDHLIEYLYRTVAHNSILIHAPASADAPAKIWGGPARTLDGGQSEFAGKQLAFETGDTFTYAATDATACYDARKCTRFVRHFLFVYPDTFVVCDDVASTQPDYAKAWLLHMADEPAILADSRTFRTEYAGSALLCRTVLPADARLSAVGGPGREFLSAGKNHPQEGRFAEVRPIEGPWRIEVTPGAPRRTDLFLHVIRVGDAGLKTLDGIESIAPGDKGDPGVRFRMTDGRELTVTFAADGKPGGHITISKGAQKTLDRHLATAVQPQVGLKGGVK